MPIVARKPHVDQETGQVAEGQRFLLLNMALMAADREPIFADDKCEDIPDGRASADRFIQ